MFLNLGSKIHSTHYNFYEFLFIRSNIPRKILFVRSNFPRSKFDFLQRLSHFWEMLLISEKSEKIFFNGFPISSTAFRFLKRLSDFFNGFPIFLNGFPFSEKSGKNLSMAANIPEIAIQASYFPPKIAIFRDKIIGSRNTKDRHNRYQSFVSSASSFVNSR